MEIKNFKQYISESISVRPFSKYADIAVRNIDKKLSDFDPTKVKGKRDSINTIARIVRKEVKAAFKGIAEDVLDIPKDHEIKVKVEKSKDPSKKGSIFYDPTQKRGHINVYILEGVLASAPFDPRVKNMLLRDIKTVIEHEGLHFDQWKRSQGQIHKSKPYVGTIAELKNSPISEHQIYLSLPHEIAAFAAQTAGQIIKELDQRGISKEDMIDKLKSKSTIMKLAKNSGIFKQYYERFGVKDTKPAKKVWNKFLKELVFQLES